MAEKPAPKKIAAQPVAKAASANAEAKPAAAPAPPAAAPRASISIAPKAKRIDEKERIRLIQEAAYFRSIAKGASPDSTHHWLAAEREVDQRLNGA